jgi:hypothetical protein
MSHWKLSGTVLIACNCDWGCPCNFNAPPTHGHCQGGWNWLVEEGEYGDVRLDGLAISVYATWPGAIHEGNGRAVAFIDDRTTDAQRAALARVVRGELGGPWGIFINTYALAGPHPAAYRVELAEHRSRLQIGDTVHLELEPIRNPVSGAEAHPEVVLPEGLVVKRASLATSSIFRVDQEIRYSHAGKYTAFGQFDYRGAAAA